MHVPAVLRKRTRLARKWQRSQQLTALPKLLVLGTHLRQSEGKFAQVIQCSDTGEHAQSTRTELARERVSKPHLYGRDAAPTSHRSTAQPSVA